MRSIFLDLYFSKENSSSLYTSNVMCLHIK